MIHLILLNLKHINKEKEISDAFCYTNSILSKKLIFYFFRFLEGIWLLFSPGYLFPPKSQECQFFLNESISFHLFCTLSRASPSNGRSETVS